MILIFKFLVHFFVSYFYQIFLLEESFYKVHEFNYFTGNFLETFLRYFSHNDILTCSFQTKYIIYNFFCKGNGKSSSGLLEFSSVPTAVEALILANHFTMHRDLRPDGKRNFCFLKWSLTTSRIKNLSERVQFNFLAT